MAIWTGLAVDAGVKLAEKAIDKVFSAKKNDPEPPLMSLGMAVGYYYNFLDTLARQLSTGSITLSDRPPQDGGAGQAMEFDLDSTNIQIILPQRLEGGDIQMCEAEFAQTLKGSFFHKENKRYYGVNYRIIDTGVSRRLTIVDLARPALALKRYYEEIVRLDTYGDGPDAERWARMQKAELVAFAETLKRLQARGYAALANKLDIVYRG
jgi:hypothetical protein